jgi:hypothetical protein
MTPVTETDLLERLTAALKSGAVITLSGEGVMSHSGDVWPVTARAEGFAPHVGFTAGEVLDMVLSTHFE